jgi:hypothetical protein
MNLASAVHSSRFLRRGKRARCEIAANFSVDASVSVVAQRRPEQARAGMRRAVWIFALGLAGCGHPATVQECEIIVERITQLEIGKRATLADAKTLEREIAEAKKSLRTATMKECVGRRITDKAMRCVRDANSSKQIIEDCFD